MACPGLGTGFLPFNTVGHKILVALYQAGDMTQRDLIEYIDIPEYGMNAISAVLKRLCDNGFVFRSHKVPGIPPLTRAVWLYTLTPTKTKKYKRKTGAERSRTYRRRKNTVQPSIFTFRGEIKL